MPKTGDKFISILKQTHLGWGIHRHTNSRRKRKDEGYIPISINDAKTFLIFNNRTSNNRIFKFSTSDGYYRSEYLLASGNRGKGDLFAKNLHGYKNLKLLGYWFKHIKAQVGDRIEVEFLSPTEILLTKLP